MRLRLTLCLSILLLCAGLCDARPTNANFASSSASLRKGSFVQKLTPPKYKLWGEYILGNWHKSDATHADIWFDSSGNGRHAYQPTYVNQPVSTDSTSIEFVAGPPGRIMYVGQGNTLNMRDFSEGGMSVSVYIPPDPAPRGYFLTGGATQGYYNTLGWLYNGNNGNDFGNFMDLRAANPCNIRGSLAYRGTPANIPLADVYAYTEKFACAVSTPCTYSTGTTRLDKTFAIDNGKMFSSVATATFTTDWGNAYRVGTFTYWMGNNPNMVYGAGKIGNIRIWSSVLPDVKAQNGDWNNSGKWTTQSPIFRNGLVREYSPLASSKIMSGNQVVVWLDTSGSGKNASQTIHTRTPYVLDDGSVFLEPSETTSLNIPKPDLSTNYTGITIGVKFKTRGTRPCWAYGHPGYGYQNQCLFADVLQFDAGVGYGMVCAVDHIASGTEYSLVFSADRNTNVVRTIMNSKVRRTGYTARLDLNSKCLQPTELVDVWTPNEGTQLRGYWIWDKDMSFDDMEKALDAIIKEKNQ